MSVTLPSAVGKRDSMQVVQRRRKAVLAGALVTSAFVLLFVRSFWAPERLVHESLEWVGIGLIGLAILGRVWSSMYLGGRKKQVVVRTGPYSIVRNPLYVFSVIGAAGVGLCTGSVLVAFLFAFATWLVFDGVIRREERYLTEHLGTPYLDYLASTPRWIPSFSKWTSTETLEVRPNLMWRTLRDAIWFFAAFPMLEALEQAQIHHWLPVLILLP